MTVTGSPPSDEAVLVGSTRAEAAEVFGTLCDHAFLTSYDDFDEEIDASRIPTLGLVAGEALEEVLTRIMVLPNGPGGQRPAVVIGLSADLHQLGSVERALTTHPSIAVAEVVSDHHRVLLYVEPADQVSPAAATEVADALDSLRRASQVGRPRSPRTSGHDASVQDAAPRPEDERPVQPRSRRDRLVRLGRRRPRGGSGRRRRRGTRGRLPRHDGAAGAGAGGRGRRPGRRGGDPVAAAHRAARRTS